MDTQQLRTGELEGCRQITDYFGFLKDEVPGFANDAIVDIASPIGISGSRRFQGLYVQADEDILASSRFKDTLGINA